jgi:hypothetical protein
MIFSSFLADTDRPKDRLRLCAHLNPRHGEDQNLKHRLLAQSLEHVRPLHQICREGRLYEVERWIADGKPIQVAPQAIPKSTRLKTALQIALETGQHSLAVLLLSKGYRIELERYSPLDMALEARGGTFDPWSVGADQKY